jgi:predicted O-methyltransferase YrrM
MTAKTTTYALGNTQPEHERLARQAEIFDPLTERLFREAGIGPGQRVLELGSGAGDVAMLVARLVGPTGEVVGVERSADSIAHATSRVSAAGLRNVSFVNTDVVEISDEKPFDAAVGRWILMFVPDPVEALRATSRLVRPGGVVAFHEVWWEPVLRAGAALPLGSVVLQSLHEMIARAGANPAMGMALRGVYRAVGLPEPAMRVEMPFDRDAEWAQWLVDTLRSVQMQTGDSDARVAALGDFDTLPKRLAAEASAAHSPAPWLAMVGTWATKPL